MEPTSSTTLPSSLGKEILVPLQLSPEQLNLVDMHSFLNVLNVLSAELQLLEMRGKASRGLQATLKRIGAFVDALEHPAHALEALKHVDTFIGRAREEVKHFVQAENLLDDPESSESVENLESVYKVLTVRCEEFVRCLNHRDKWIPFNISELRRKFMLFFSAVEKNSHGRYRLVFNIAEQQERDYLVSFDIKSIHKTHINMPPKLEDVMRDIIANARKYTPPGGTIAAGLSEDTEGLRFVCEDSGMGIPEDEIEKVVSFGSRGANVQNIPTRGGGFGLTKAYAFVKQQGGRIWIRSGLNKGTRLTLFLPARADLTHI